MYSNIVVVFSFVLSQWSLTPQAFKEAVLAAALAKCVLAVIWWTTRMLVAKFPPMLRSLLARNCSTPGRRSSSC